MELKDILTVTLSTGAICFSIASFIFSFRQRDKEDKRGMRKALTDVIADLMKIALAQNQLDIDHPNSKDRKIIAFRRTYNSQRRYLANHGEFLVQQIPELAADIDCITLGSAFDDLGDYDKAERFFKLAVEKAPSPSLQAWNLRALARFWFKIGNASLGRKTYDQSLQIKLPDTDSMRHSTADTYLLWARVELDHGYLNEGNRLRELAVSAAKRIGNYSMRSDMLGQIESVFSEFKDGDDAA